MDDHDLVERSRRGDRDAFREIVERHQDEVFYLGLGLLRNRHDAEDLVQEVFIRAYKSLDRFRSQASLGTWLYRIAVNACRDHQRRQRFEALEESLGRVSEPEGRWVEERPDADPHRSAAGGELRRHVARAMERLSAAERSVFVLRHFNQLSIRETAAVLGRAEGTVKSLLYRALQKLQKELAVYRDAEEVT